MKTIFLAAAALVLATCTPVLAHPSFEETLAQDRTALLEELWECKYTTHPISDAAWEMYRQGMIPRGTATYYTGAVRSANIGAAKCLNEALPVMWKGRDTSWTES